MESMKQVERAKSSHAVNKITVLTHWNLHYVAHITLWGSLFAAISLVVLWTHWPALSAKALSFDDNQYLTENTLVQHPSWASAKRFFGEVLTPSTVKGYYQPLTMISLVLDDAMGGRPGNLYVFHRTSLTLHVLNPLLVSVLLYLL